MTSENMKTENMKTGQYLDNIMNNVGRYHWNVKRPVQSVKTMIKNANMWNCIVYRSDSQTDIKLTVAIYDISQ